MDCDDVAMLLAAKNRPTLTGREETQLDAHVNDCASCRQLATDLPEEDWRWIARVPEEALADDDLLVLPTIDPVVFSHQAELAAGGMGRISRVKDRRLGRVVAVKEMLEPDMRARFEREATITAGLQHPAIVPIYEAGTFPDGSAFYTMRLVSGGTLADAIAKATTLQQRLALLPNVIAVTEALAYAHSRGIIHRDLKPGNILVGEFGETVVIDWGLAKHLRDADDVLPERTLKEDLTRVGSVMGTPGFMAPEQAAGEALDERADVYALGSILYHVLTGSPPYWDELALRMDSDLLVDTARKRPPTSIATRSPQAPADLMAIVEHAMARPKENRYPTAKEMAEELRRFEQGKLLASREYGLRDLLGRWIHRHSTAVIVGVIAVLALAGVGAMAIVNVAKSRSAERDALRVAQESRTDAVANLAALLEEQGRTELLDGDHDRALAYLAESFRLGRDTTALRHTLALATADLDLAQDLIDDQRRVRSLLVDDLGRLVSLGAGGISVWDGRKLVASLALDDDVPAIDAHARRAATQMNQNFEMWDVASKRRLWQDAKLSFDFVLGIQFSASAKRFVTIPRNEAGVPQESYIVETDTGKRLATIKARFSEATFSDDDRLLATCDDGTLTIYDATTGTLIEKLGNPDLDLRWVRFVDGETIASAGVSGAVVWRFSGKYRKSYVLDTSTSFTALAVSSTTLVAAAVDDGTVRVWSDDGDLVAQTQDSPSRLDKLVFSPDGKFLAASGWDRRAYIWESDTLELLRALPAGKEHVTDIAWTADGHFVTADTTSTGARIWRLPRGVRVAQFASNESATTERKVASIEGEQLLLYDVVTGALEKTVEMKYRMVFMWGSGQDAAGTVQISDDARRAVVATKPTTVLVDLDTGVKHELPKSGRDDPLLARNGRFVIIPSEDNEHVRVFEGATGKPVVEIAVSTSHLVLSPNAELLLALSYDGLRAFHLPSGAPAAFPMKLDETFLAFDPTGARMLVPQGDDGVLYDARSGTALARLLAGSSINRARFDRRGRSVLTYTSDRAVRAWDAKTGRQLALVDAVMEGTFAISNDGLRFATGYDDGTIRIWETTTGRLLQSVHAHRKRVKGLAFAADDTRLVSWGDDSRTRIFDTHLETRDPEEIGALAARHAGWVFQSGQLVRK